MAAGAERSRGEEGDQPFQTTLPGTYLQPRLHLPTSRLVLNSSEDYSKSNAFSQVVEFSAGPDRPRALRSRHVVLFQALVKEPRASTCYMFNTGHTIYRSGSLIYFLWLPAKWMKQDRFLLSAIDHATHAHQLELELDPLGQS